MTTTENTTNCPTCPGGWVPDDANDLMGVYLTAITTARCKGEAAAEGDTPEAAALRRFHPSYLGDAARFVAEIVTRQYAMDSLGYGEPPPPALGHSDPPPAPTT